MRKKALLSRWIFVTGSHRLRHPIDLLLKRLTSILCLLYHACGKTGQPRHVHTEASRALPFNELIEKDDTVGLVIRSERHVETRHVLVLLELVEQHVIVCRKKSEAASGS